MIDKAYWNMIAAQWKKQDDGIDIPVPPPIDLNIDDDEDNSEINEILADLGLDDI